jgi:hypothetical protein
MVNKEDDNWLTSKDVKSLLKVTDCKLSHLRNDGHLEFRKKGNAFLYSKEHIVKNIINND